VPDALQFFFISLTKKLPVSPLKWFGGCTAEEERDGKISGTKVLQKLKLVLNY
jgi:hypothetical protein